MVSYIEKIVGIYLGFYNAACLTLLNTIIVGLVIQIQVLQYELSDYDKLYQRGNEITDSDDLPTILGLNKLIEKHQNLLSYSSVLNEALKIPILIEYSVSSISIATILVQILKSSDASFYIFMVLLVAVELLFFCLNAHDIVVESLRLGEAVYFSNWYERDVPTQKSIRIIMMRSRIPMHVSIGPFGILNAESLISIFKVAYSYVSLLSGEK
ncbi:odorant receptor 45b-like [Rhynchophorus ferrugineus]